MIRAGLLAAVLGVGIAKAAAPPDAASLAWLTNPGAQVPMDTMLRDEAGHAVRLSQVGEGAPIILDLGYFHCPTLCGIVRQDLLGALATSGLAEGRDYELVSLSIDPAETAADAAQAKAEDLRQAPFATGRGWHYLTGAPGAVAAVTAAVGFRDRYDAQLQQFMHPAGLAILTRSGVVSGYLLGVGYNGGELRAAVLRAGKGGIAQSVLPVLLLCFHFDETTGRYTLEVMKVLRLAAGLTVITIVGLFAVLHRRQRPAG